VATYSISGDLLDTNLETLRACVKAAFSIAYLNESKLDIYFENDTCSIYIYDYGTPYPSGNWDFLINISYATESIQEVIDVLKKLAIALHQHDIVYNFEFYKEHKGEIDAANFYVIRHSQFSNDPYGVIIHIDEIS
jgi:hypothetical protein